MQNVCFSKKKLVFRQMSQSQIPRKKKQKWDFSLDRLWRSACKPTLRVDPMFKMSKSTTQKCSRHVVHIMKIKYVGKESQIEDENIYSYYNHNKPSSQKPQKSSKIEKWTMFFSLCCFFFTAVQHLFGGGQLFNFVLQFLKAAMVVKKKPPCLHQLVGSLYH